MSPTHTAARSELDKDLHHERKKERKTQPRVFPDRDCLAKVAGKKVTPSGLNRLLARLRELRSAEREGLVKANNITSL